MNRRYFGNNSRLTRLFAGSVVCALIFVWSVSSKFHSLTDNHGQNQGKAQLVASSTLDPQPTKTIRNYLVKLRGLPQFNGNSVGLKDFDKLVADGKGQISDLFAANDGEDGRWIVVAGDEDLRENLWLNSRDLEEIEPNQVVTLSDPNWSASVSTAEKDKTWGLRVSKVKEGLSVLKPRREILVGVVDTGCDLKHPALKDRLVKGHNFAGGDVNDPSNRNDNEMHATHVSGTIIAKADSDGFFGIANTVAKVMPVRVLNEGGSGTLIDVARGIEYAADHGVHVINMSLGATMYSRALHDVVKYAVNEKGVTVVCAKGNSNTDRPHYPSDFPECIRVTASALRDDGTEERAYFSNYGKNSTCAAPGHIIYSTLPGGKYGFASGTSMACPHAAGCAAVILSQGNFTPEEVKKIIETRGDELKTDQPIGKRINLLKFVQKAAHELMPAVNNHPYGKCCVDAGIVSRDTYNFGDNGNLLTALHQDSDGSYDLTHYGESGTTTTYGSTEHSDWFMTFTPKGLSPAVYTSSVSGWCWRCADFHEANSSCAGVRLQPSMPYQSPTEIHVADWCTICDNCHTPKCPADTSYSGAGHLMH